MINTKYTCLLFLFLTLIQLVQGQTIKTEKLFGYKGNDYAFALQKTVDSGYILGGISELIGEEKVLKTSTEIYDLWLVKLNKSLEKEWEFKIGGTNNDRLVDLIEVPDRGYIICGSSSSEPSKGKQSLHYGIYDYWIIFIDLKGKLIWEKTFGGDQYDQGLCVANDKKYIYVAGTSKSGTTGNKEASLLGADDIWLLKLDYKGKKIWEKTFGGNRDDFVLSILLNKNKIVVFGASSSYDFIEPNTEEEAKNELIIFEIDQNGTLLKGKKIHCKGEDYPTAFLKNKNGNYILCSNNSLYLGAKKTYKESYQNQLMIYELDQNLEESIWSKSIATPDQIFLQDITESASGHYWLTGAMETTQRGFREIPILLQLDKEGKELHRKELLQDSDSTIRKVLSINKEGKEKLLVLGSKEVESNKRDFWFIELELE